MSKIKSITKHNVGSLKLWNLAVEEDESFIANEVVVHNCKSWIRPILKGKLGDREITSLKPTKSSLDKYVQFSEVLDGNSSQCQHCGHEQKLSPKCVSD